MDRRGRQVRAGESPEECICRETLEETGLTLTEYQYRGIVTFFVRRVGDGYMHLFTATGWTGTVQECDEGVLEWIHKDALAALPQWGGQDLPAAYPRRGHAVFSLKLRYEGERLVYAALDGKEFTDGMILVSACLLGCACRYDEQSKPHPLAMELARQGRGCAGVPGAAGRADHAALAVGAAGRAGGHA